MRARVLGSVVVVLVAPFQVATGAAVAAEPTCQGYAATIVSDGTEPQTYGTQGPDVIVVTGPTRVDALGGDDVVCMEGGSIAGGDGNDSVESALGSARSTQVSLGLGDDRYKGGPGADTVFGHLGEEGAEHISTGGGRDDVGVSGSGDGADVVDMGPGRDTGSFSLAAGADAAVEGGRGRDQLNVDGYHGDALDWDVDLILGTVSRDGLRVLKMSGIERHRASFTQKDTLQLRGTPTADYVEVMAGAADIRTRGGSDTVAVLSFVPRDALTGFVDAGQGAHDLLAIQSSRTAELDLARGRATLEGSTGFRHRGFDDGYVSSALARLTGDEAANRLFSVGCRVRVEGGDGRDTLRPAALGRFYYSPAPRCDEPKSVLNGGPGDDRMIGRKGPDVLIGGLGFDTARGRGGVDSCRAERERDCER